MSREIDIIKSPLEGTNLIEANAGTGKTYTITALFIRMILEKGLTIDKILVVTFTKAAVSDLKSKIYEKLIEAQKGTESSDYFVSEYFKLREEDKKDDTKKLKDAVRDFDQCSIFTIHSFCQKLLTENAFSGKIPYDTELTGEIENIIRKPVQNFWRKVMYKAPLNIIPHIKSFRPKDMEAFVKELENSPAIEVIKPEPVSYDDIATAEKAVELAFERVKLTYINDKDGIENFVRECGASLSGYTEKPLTKTFEMLNIQIEQNITAPYLENDSIKRLSQKHINSKPKKGKTAPEHEFFTLVEEWIISHEELQSRKKGIISNIRYDLYLEIKDILTEYKIRKNIQSYNDLISRMRAAVCDNNGQNSMVAGIQKKFSATMIDEFQDTDPYQFDIFNTVFGKHNMPFFMIGDPKQAIYSFRGADVYAYLQAKKGVIPKTLTMNHRSDKDLVRAVNEFFKSDNPFMVEDIPYNKSEGKNSYKLKLNGEVARPMTLWSFKKEAMIPNEVAAEISMLLNSSKAGNATLSDGEAERPLKTSDIAVLTRSNTEGRKIKEALSQLGIPSVISGSSSVYESEEAIEMIHLLEAVINPFSARAIKTLFASDIFNYTADRLINITEEKEWDTIVETFVKYNEILNLRGIAPMFFRMASDIKLQTHISNLKNGERKLTNLIHIIELLQKEEADKQASPNDLLRFIKDKNSKDGNSYSSRASEEEELKMESDENAITIMTIHKSKGLEYNIVFAPYLTSSSKDKGYSKYHKDNKYIIDISDDTESKELQKEEEFSENIRLIYVALTRAKYVCYTAFKEPEKSKSKPIEKMVFGDEKPNSSLLTSKLDTSLIDIREIEERTGASYNPETPAPSSDNRTFEADIKKVWQINSFSRLVHSAPSAKDTDQFVRNEEKIFTNEKNIFTFPKGAKAGSCLHDCLEHIDFKSSTRDEIEQIVSENLIKYMFDEEFLSPVVENILTIINSELTKGVRLSELDRERYVPEMEFHISSKNFTSENLSKIFEKYREHDFSKYCKSTDFNSKTGFINGFADLIFEKDGKYFILDWKSNHLGEKTSDYSEEAMNSAMLESHYYLQLYIYTLALHIHLKNCMDDYDYERHMGGGLYIFMRGVNETSNEGVYFHKPKAEIISEMEELIKRCQ